MYLQAVRQLGDGLLQEQGHEQEVQLGNVGVFGKQRLQDGESREVAGVPVDLSDGGASAGAATHVEAWRRTFGKRKTGVKNTVVLTKKKEKKVTQF